MAEPQPPKPVQSVERAAQILDLLADVPELGVSEIARRLGVHRSTAYRLLATLESANLVEQEVRRGLYRLGLGVLRLAGAVTARIDLVRDAQVVCDQVVGHFDETANVAILDDRTAVNVTQTMSTQRIAVLREYVGQRTPPHATSTGKVLLAHAAPGLRDAVLEAPLERFTATTVTDPAYLRAELEIVAARGWAATDAEWEENTNAVAVPVRGAAGEVVAALSVSAPRFRMPPERFAAVAAELGPFGVALSRRLGYLAPAAP